MSVFQNALMFATLAYGALYDLRFLYLFLGFLGFNFVMHFMIPKGKWNSTRRKIMNATWEEPKEGCVYTKNEVDCTKVNALLKSYTGPVKPTLTHFGIKAMAQVLNSSRTSVNGKFVFGRYIPFPTVDVTCLVDIEGGSDLAAVTVQSCDEQSVIDIAKYIHARASVVKKNKGDDEHKKRTGSAVFFPPFLLSLLLQITKFISCYLGLSVPAIGLKKDGFGGAVVTSLGPLGIEDAYAPHCNFMNVPVFAAMGKTVERAVVREGKIVTAPVMYMNFTIDHRFIDGGKSKNISKAFNDVFENPEKYFDVKQQKFVENAVEEKPAAPAKEVVESAPVKANANNDKQNKTKKNK